MRLFISHASEDKNFALKLFRLPEYIKTWIDIRELAAGQTLDSSITLAIAESHVFVVLVSEISQEKDWVRKEVEWALDREPLKNRVFVLPILIDSDLNLESSPAPLNQLANRLHINASDISEKGVAVSQETIKDTLLNWACKWIENVEPTGDSNRLFTQQLEAALVEYQTSLFSVNALLSWPLEVLSRKESKVLMIESQKNYSKLTKTLTPQLADFEDEIRWRFGASTQKAFGNLATYVRNDIFHGAAYSMNDIVESVNAYHAVLLNDEEKLNQARAVQHERVDALSRVLDELVRRTAEFISTIK